MIVMLSPMIATWLQSRAAETTAAASPTVGGLTIRATRSHERYPNPALTTRLKKSAIALACTVSVRSTPLAPVAESRCDDRMKNVFRKTRERLMRFQKRRLPKELILFSPRRELRSRILGGRSGRE
jgi:hypothetical protein